MKKISENQYRINGHIYDIRNSTDEKFILECIENIQKSKEKGNSNKKVIINDKGGWDCPLNTEYINDKKMDYKTLGIMTVFSNCKTSTICEMLDMDISEQEYHRYLYEKGDNSIWSNRMEIEKLSQNKIRTIYRNINKLIQCGNKVVTAEIDKEGKVYYKICPYTKYGNGMGKFVTIDSRILKYMINVFNSTSIKVYCTLKWMLYDKEKKCYIEKQLTYDFIAKQIGLSNYGKGLNNIGDILGTFAKVGLVTRTPMFYLNDSGERIKSYKYKLNSYEEFRKIFKSK